MKATGVLATDDGNARDDAFIERMGIVIELAGGPAELSQKSSLSRSVIHKYGSGGSDPSRLRLVAIAKAAGVSVEWLATGEGPMLSGDRVPLGASTQLDKSFLSYLMIEIYAIILEYGGDEEFMQLPNTLSTMYANLCSIYEHREERFIGAKTLLHQFRETVRAKPGHDAEDRIFGVGAASMLYRLRESIAAKVHTDEATERGHGDSSGE